MEAKYSPKLLSVTQSCSLPNFSKKASNTVWYDKFQKQHSLLEKKVRLSGKVQKTFQDIMNMMKINRDYFQSEHKYETKKQEYLPKVKLSRETGSDENIFFEKVSGVLTIGCQFKSKQKQKQNHSKFRFKIHKKQLKKKKFAYLPPFEKQPNTFQNQLQQFLIQKQKQRYRQKLSLHKSIPSSCNNSNIPGQYVPNKLIEILHRKTHTSDWEI